MTWFPTTISTMRPMERITAMVLTPTIGWNCGVEGLTNDPTIEALRLRQIKNFLATLMLSQGVPMLLAGDEIRRTQQGNNNAYCQNNALGWFDWQLVEKNAAFESPPAATSLHGT